MVVKCKVPYLSVKPLKIVYIPVYKFKLLSFKEKKTPNKMVYFIEINTFLSSIICIGNQLPIWHG